VLELEDLEDGPVDLDVVSVLELVGADDGRSALSRANFGLRFAETIAAWVRAQATVCSRLDKDASARTRSWRARSRMRR
jgi:hypothetical protein